MLVTLHVFQVAVFLVPESVVCLTDAEMDKLIRDESNKVLKVADKPTKSTKKKLVKVIEKVVDTSTNKCIRKVPVRFTAK
jgi:hypothetical protein